MLLHRLLAGTGLDLSALRAASSPFPTGQDLALGIRGGAIDCGIATHAVASGDGLAFVPLAWEAFDLVLHHRTYFLPGSQALLALMREARFSQQASLLGGYDVTQAGTVRFSR